jgi:hypothetical protein
MHPRHHFLCSALVAAFTAAACQAAPPEITSPATRAYRLEQSQRLAARDDRDSRIAAALLAIPRDSHVSGLSFADVKTAQALLQPLGDDVPALYLAALVCHLSAECSDTHAVDRLTARAPENALHWLLRPGVGPIDDPTLHRAAAGTSAEPHLGELGFALDRALADAEPAQQRRDARDALPMPHLAPAMDHCKGATADRRDDCLAVGRLLFGDAKGTILTRTIGSVMLRRLAPDSTDAVAAKTFRRDYVWLGEHDIAGRNIGGDALQKDTQRFGEWEGWLRAADRAGVARTPPADWKPRDPQQLLLPEERGTPAR